MRIMMKNEHKTFEPQSKVTVENLDPRATHKELHEFFKQGVLDLALVLVKEGRNAVQYRNARDAALAIEQLNGEEIYGKKIRLSLFVDAAKRNLYFKHLPKGVSKKACEDAVANELSRYGDLESLRVETDEN
jgi:hypothetical protein